MPHALLGPARRSGHQPQTGVDVGPVRGRGVGRPWSLGLHLPDHTPCCLCSGAQPGEPTRRGAAGRLCRRKRRCGPRASAGPRSPRIRPPSWGTAPRPAEGSTVGLIPSPEMCRQRVGRLVGPPPQPQTQSGRGAHDGGREARGPRGSASTFSSVSSEAAAAREGLAPRPEPEDAPYDTPGPLAGGSGAGGPPDPWGGRTHPEVNDGHACAVGAAHDAVEVLQP